MNHYLALKRIEFLVTYLCNGKCAHCYATKYSEGLSEHIDKFLAVDIVREVGKNFNIESLMTFGGEPLLFPGVVYSIHNEAARIGIPLRQVITNGFWSNNTEKIKQTAKKLAKSGVNDVHFSVDTFHQEHISLEIVGTAIESCVEFGIEDIVLNPCWVISKEADNMYNKKTKSILDKLQVFPVRVSKGNIVEPSGLALKNLSEYLPSKKCYLMANVVICHSQNNLIILLQYL